MSNDLVLPGSDPFETLLLAYEEELAAGTSPETALYAAGQRYPAWSTYLPQLRAFVGLLERAWPQRASSPSGKTKGPTVAGLAIPGYEILTELGHGGMGVVYKARQVHLQRLVALKVIRADVQVGADAYQRFCREAKMAASLQHPNMVQIYEIGEHDSQPYFAMELVDGLSLAHRLAGGALPARQAATLVEILAHTIHHAHERGVVHRDLKPANVLLSGNPNTPIEQCTPKIVDFGLAKQFNALSQTQSGAVVGTPCYMAPEQADSTHGALGPAADIYALGTILYELLTGRPPFVGTSMADVLEQVRSQEPVAPSRLSTKVPRDLDTICLKCLQKEPNRRYATAQELAEDLQRFLTDQPIRARPVGPGERGIRWCRRNPMLAVLAAALLAVAVGGLAGITYQWLQAERNFAEAETARQEAEDYVLVVNQLLSDLLHINRDPVLRAPTARWQRQTEVLTRAEGHYLSLLQQRPTNPRLLDGLANLYAEMADLGGSGWGTNGTIDLLQKALALWRQLSQDPGSGLDWRPRMARAHDRLGGNYRSQGRLAESLESFRSACALFEQLAEGPSAYALRLELAGARLNLVLVLFDLDRDEEARRLLDANRTLLEELVQAQPTNLVSWGRLTKTYWLLAERSDPTQPDAALLRRQREVVEHWQWLLRSQPEAIEYVYDMTWSIPGLPGEGLLVGEAASAFERAAEGLEAQAKEEPTNLRLLATLARCYGLLSIYWQRTRKYAEALRAAEQPARIWQEQAVRFPSDVSVGVQLAGSLVRVASVQNLLGRRNDLAETNRQIIALLTRLTAEAREPEFRRCLAYHWTSLSTSARNGLGLSLDQSLDMAEQARRLCEGLVREEPELSRNHSLLSDAWTQIAKVHWRWKEYGQVESALRQALAAARKAHALVPGTFAYRNLLDDRLRRLGRILNEQGRLVETEDCLRERERLWPDRPTKFRELAAEWREQADDVSKGKEQLTPAEQAQQKRYLEEALRLERAAAALAAK